jgi:hypothetical protein
MMVKLAKEHSIKQLSQTLEVARSGYYRWRQGPSCARDVANGRLVQEIKSVHKAMRGTYGSRGDSGTAAGGHECSAKPWAFDAAAGLKVAFAGEKVRNNRQ